MLVLGGFHIMHFNPTHLLLPHVNCLLIPSYARSHYRPLLASVSTVSTYKTCLHSTPHRHIIKNTNKIFSLKHCSSLKSWPGHSLPKQWGLTLFSWLCPYYEFFTHLKKLGREPASDFQLHPQGGLTQAWQDTESTVIIVYKGGHPARKGSCLTTWPFYTETEWKQKATSDKTDQGKCGANTLMCLIKRCTRQAMVPFAFNPSPFPNILFWNRFA